MITRVMPVARIDLECGLGRGHIVINANVITVEKDHPSAQAFAIEKGRSTAVGTMPVDH